MWFALIIWIILGLLLALIIESLVWPSRYTLAENIVASLVGATLLGLLGSQAGAIGTATYWWAAIGSFSALAFLRWFGQKDDALAATTPRAEDSSVSAVVPAQDEPSPPVDVAAADESGVDEPPTDSVTEPTPETPAAEEPTLSTATDEVADEVADNEDVSTDSSPINNNYPDDLTQIHGIGKVYERKLYEAGIYTYAQVAQTDIAQLNEYANAIEAANVADWPRQAGELAAKHGRENAVYEGPLPDKFAILPTLSESTEQRLYRVGILTYEQLAAAAPETLHELLPKSLQSGKVNVNDWIVAAREKLTT